ncbi:hypothetical protein P3T76_012070 [Phytophthora citrophthora]|uniref:Uncharacterized protein n=1 Tax=Phytophthora citrophthora TaxID=4793 RepID=A0AAD9G606_9STRA|nr:hypothetical protein P3T76_012070 [Phytophthora citrophthora]
MGFFVPQSLKAHMSCCCAQVADHWINEENEESWRQRITLGNATAELEELACGPVDEDANQCALKKCHHGASEILPKPDVLQDQHQGRPKNTIEGFGVVQKYCTGGVPAKAFSQRLEILEAEKGIPNGASLNKPGLVGVENC